MLGVNVFAADTDAEARLLSTSLQQAFVNLRRGRRGQLPPPGRDIEESAGRRRSRRCSRRCSSCSVVGSPETVRGAA